jgi:hypothetical protein
VALIHVPFEAGLNDSTDPVLTDGRLYQAENVRFHKQGRVSKKYGLESPVYSGATGMPNAVGQWNGTPFIVGNERLSLFPLDGPSGSQHYIQHPLAMSPVLPRKSEVVAANQRNTNRPLMRADVCALSNTLIYTYDYGNASISLDAYWSFAVRTNDGATLYQPPLRTGWGPRALSWIGQSTAIIAFFQNDGLCATRVSGQAPYELAQATALAQLTGCFDAIATATPDEWYSVTRQQDNTLLVQRFSGFTELSNSTLTVGGPTMSVTISVADYGVLIVYVLSTGQARAVSLNTSLATAVSTGTVSSSFNFAASHQQAAIYPASSTNANVLLEAIEVASGMSHRLLSGAELVVSSLGGGHSPAGQRSFYHLGLASKPFQMGGRWFTWCSVDNDMLNPTTDASVPSGVISGWTNQRGYWMLDVTNLGTTSEAAAPILPLAMTSYPMQASIPYPTGTRAFLPQAVQSQGSGAPYWVTPLIEPIRQRESVTASGTTGDLTQLQAVSWHSGDNGNNQQRVLNKRRDWVDVHGGLQFAGGFISEMNGSLVETGFTNYPVISRVRRGTGMGGSLATGTWSYSAVYEWTDPLGRVQQSNPADPVTIGVGIGDGAILDIARPLGGKWSVPVTVDPGDVVVVVYRTTIGGTTYYRTTRNLSNTAIVPTMSAPTVNYIDTRSDLSLQQRQILYTQGGVLGNIIPPAARYEASGGSRLWLAGLLRPRQVQFSKLLVRGEPVNFPDDDSFRIDLPEDITGIKWGDGTLIVFSEENIYLINGDGPNDQGAGSFSTPQRMPSDVGCVEHFSIVEIQDGWLFQSRRGIYLLPRGFGPPVFVGAEIQDTLLAYPTVRSATAVVDSGGSRLGESTVRYVVSDSDGNTRVPVWDTALKRWVSVDKYESNDLALVGNQANHAVVVRDSLLAPNPVRRETAAAWGDGSQATGFVQSRIRTGNIRPFGLIGWGRISEIEVMGEIRDSAKLRARVSTDGATGTDLYEVLKVGDPGKRLHHQVKMPVAYCNSLDIEFSDVASGASEGLVLHGITLDVEPSEGLPRRGADERS